MLNYIIRRLGISLVMLFGIGLVSFLVIKMVPGDYATTYEGYLMGRVRRKKMPSAWQMQSAKHTAWTDRSSNSFFCGSREL